MASLRIALDARLVDGALGGVQQVIIGLASAFSQLRDGDEEYFFLTYSDSVDWLSPYLSGPCHLLSNGPMPQLSAFREKLTAFPGLRGLFHRVGPLFQKYKVPQSDGIIERAKIDVMHFTMQGGFLTTIANVYTPHDLQHVHLPEFFTSRQLATRDVLYQACCDQAGVITAMSEWGKEDLIRHLSLPVEKVAVVPWGSVLSAYRDPTPAEMSNATAKFRLNEPFIFYPSQTYPHKNHIGLLRAIAHLRDHDGVRVRLLCAGRCNEFFPKIKQELDRLNLADQVEFLDFVSATEMRCLYRAARGMVLPTLFEGWGLPLLEAFSSGTAVACSNVTCLPAIAQDAALIFDPRDIPAMAEACRKLWEDAELRQVLINRAKERASQFDWLYTARLLRAHYRRIAKRNITEEDYALLNAKPLV